MKTRRGRFLALITSLLLAPGSLLAQGGGMLLTGADRQPALSLGLEIRAEVSGLLARVWITQVFRYDGETPVEGIYQFPLPPDAAVDTLQVTLGQRVIVGEVRERGEARAQYDKARRAGRKAALIEQEKANLFTTAVANIEPGLPVRVEIAYQQSIPYQAGVFELRLPLAVTPPYQPDGLQTMKPAPTEAEDCECGASPTGVSLEVVLNDGLMLHGFASPSHHIQTTAEGERYRVRLATDTPLDRDFVLRWQPLVEEQVAAAVYTERVAGEDHALLLLMPGLAPRRATRREIILVIDTSGSMAGTSLEQARAALIAALAGLEPDDRFNVVQFNDHAESLYPESVPAGTFSRAQAENYIRYLTARGGTEMAAALETALGGPPRPGYLRQVVFVTDGAIGNEAELFALVAAHIGDARLFTVGIGPAPNQLFMEHAARAGRGTATYISASADVTARMTELFQRISMPVLTDVAISVPDRGEILSIPDVYAGEPQAVTLKLPVGIGVINVTGLGDGATWGQQIAIAEERDAPGVGRLWARQRIRDLMLSQAGGADPELVREQIVQLGLGYGLTSRYTSLVAVEQIPSSGQTALKRATVPTPVAAVSFPATAAGLDHHLLWSLLSLGLGLAVLQSRNTA